MRGDAFRFAENMTHVQQDSEAWRGMMSGGFVEQDESGGWWITESGRERLAELEA